MGGTHQPAAGFSGFTKKTISFIRGIRNNNNQDWFESHRADYEQHYVAPARAFVETLGPQLAKLRPGIGFNPDHNGRGSIKKIFTDRRFNPDRDPYKPWLDVMFWEGPLKAKKDNSCFGLRLEPQQLTFFAGLKHMDRPVLKAYRDVVSTSGAGLAAAIRKTGKHPGLQLCEPHYAKVPRGYDPEHPNADLLRHDSLYVFNTQKIPEAIYSPELIKTALSQFKQMQPIQGWLADMLNEQL